MFQLFIRIEASATNEEDFLDWSGYVESKYHCISFSNRIRYLANGIPHKENVMAFPYPQRVMNPARAFSVRFFIAIVPVMVLFSLNLSEPINSFIDILRL